MRIGRLFIGWGKTNEDNRHVLASWEKPCGYWRWHLSFYSRVNGIWRIAMGPSMDMGRRYRVGGHFGAWATFLGWSISLSTQPDWPR